MTLRDLIKHKIVVNHLRDFSVYTFRINPQYSLLIYRSCIRETQIRYIYKTWDHSLNKELSFKSEML